MSLTSRKKRPLDRSVKHFRDTKLIVVAVEGEKTEKQYLEMFRNTRVQVRVLPTTEGRSAPEQVFDRLLDFKKEFQLGEDDESWLMIDVDRWGDGLARVCQDAYGRGVSLAVSNPCFEVWLYLHFGDVPDDRLTCRQFEDLIRHELGGYKKNQIDRDTFLPNVPAAIERARALDANPTERWPSTTGTRVYKLVEKLFVARPLDPTADGG